MKSSLLKSIATLILVAILITSCSQNNLKERANTSVHPSSTTPASISPPIPTTAKSIAKEGLFNADGIFEMSKSLTGTGGGLEPIKDITPYAGGEITLPVTFRFSAYNDLSNIIITLDGIPQMFTVLQEDPAEGQSTPALNHYVKHPQGIEKATYFTFHVKFTPSIGKTGDVLACSMIAMNLPDVWFDPECTTDAKFAKAIHRVSSTFLKFEADGNPNQPAPPPHPSGITCAIARSATEPTNVIFTDGAHTMDYRVNANVRKAIIVEEHPAPIKFDISIDAIENHRLNTICIVDKTPILIANELSLQHGWLKRGERVKASIELDVSKATDIHTVMILGNWVGSHSGTKSGYMAMESAPRDYYVRTIFREADFPNHLFKTP